MLFNIMEDVQVLYMYLTGGITKSAELTPGLDQFIHSVTAM